jgi:hypothetical protein
MGYTPELSDYHSATLRRIAWALGKPMTKTIETLFDNLDLTVDPAKICERCRDKSHCDSCYFKSREKINKDIPIDPILFAYGPARQGLYVCETEKTDPASTRDKEAAMKVHQVSVMVSKKIGKNFCSCSVSYGATAAIEEEHYIEAIAKLDAQLRDMVSTALPTPNGNENGNGHSNGKTNGNGYGNGKTNDDKSITSAISTK